MSDFSEAVTEASPVDAAVTDADAPHGRDPHTGDPLAPYGYRADGRPRLSRRGRSAGSKKASAPRKRSSSSSSSSSSSAAKKGPDYTEAGRGVMMLAAMPFQVASMGPVGFLVGRFLGEKYVTACAGNAAIVNMFTEPGAAAIAGVAEVNPGVARRLESGGIKVPYIIALKTGMDLVGALVQNFVQPSQELAETGKQMMILQSQQVRAQIEEIARAEQEKQRAAAEAAEAA